MTHDCSFIKILRAFFEMPQAISTFAADLVKFDMSSLPHYLLLLVFLNAALFNEYELTVPLRHTATTTIGEKLDDPYQSTSLFEFLIRTCSDRDLPVPEDEDAADPDIIRRSTSRQSQWQSFLPAMIVETLSIRINPILTHLTIIQPVDTSATIVFGPVREHLHLYYMF
ncbi:MAG: hypothetical protein MUE95_15550 [Cyclobacteriaceae bacterium]|jgi:hypothetical protein|nr:hypothetical protein [Cyclobacteriaceae bacterium]